MQALFDAHQRIKTCMPMSNWYMQGVRSASTAMRVQACQNNLLVTSSVAIAAAVWANLKNAYSCALVPTEHKAS